MVFFRCAEIGTNDIIIGLHDVGSAQILESCRRLIHGGSELWDILMKPQGKRGRIDRYRRKERLYAYQLKSHAAVVGGAKLTSI